MLILLLMLTAAATTQERKVGVEKFEVPKYPPIARAARIFGQVQLLIEVAADGRVISAKLAKGAHPILSDAALENVKHWKFSCFSCRAGDTFHHEVSYSYKFGEVEATEYSFPSQVIVVTTPPPPDQGTWRIKMKPWWKRLFSQ